MYNAAVRYDEGPSSPLRLLLNILWLVFGGFFAGLGWLLPIPFYFLELLVGLVQALVFMLLTAVFTLLICEHEEESPATAHD